MSEEEIRRAGVLSRVKGGELKLVEAVAWLKRSYRQVKRMWRRWQQQGARGLVHSNAGQRSHHARGEEFRQRVLALVRAHYGGPPEARFGPTLAAEHLEADHGVKLQAETLRWWMLREGLWSRERRRKPYRQRRPRKGHFGELVQLDGSFHHWLEERGERGCLISLVDDATGVTLSQFAREETTWAVAEVVRAWVERYGIPRAIYADWKNVYQHEPTGRQQQEGEVPVSQFGRMCAKLGIELIGANSPQAKGRVERNHGTHQDRLIKKMRLRQISCYQEANRFLGEVYLAQHNAQYAVEPAESVDFHEAVPKSLDLDEVFCLEEERTVSNDWVVRYKNRQLQIQAGSAGHVTAGEKVLVREKRDGSLELIHRRQRLPWEEFAGKPRTEIRPVVRRRPPRYKPAADHPWRRRVVGAVR